MIYILIILGILCILLGLFLFGGLDSLTDVKFNDIRKHMTMLYFRGHDDGFFILTMKKHRKFLQFKKRIIRCNHIEILSMFPLNDKTKDVYYDVKRYISTKYNNSFSVYATGFPEGSHVQETVTVTFSGENTLEESVEFAEYVFKNIFKVTEHQNMVFRPHGISPRAERIGFD